MDVVDQLKTTGRVSRGWLGVLIQDVTLDLAESFGMKNPRGALVAKVLPDSPAKAAGIKVGDIITKFDGKEVMKSSSLPPIVGSSKVGVKIPVEIIRDARKKVLKVKLGELPEDEVQARASKPETETANRLGITVSKLDDDVMKELDIDHGVVVDRVITGAASHAGVRKGDIILSVDNTPVKNPQQFQSMIDDFPAGKSVAMLIQRGGSPTFLAMKVPE
jgi:serine protease Do